MSVKWLEGVPINRENRYPPIARYVHSGNKVIQPISLDKATGIFTTSEPLGLPLGMYTSGGDIIMVPHEFTNGIIPREIVNTERYYLNIKSDTTFTLYKDFAKIEVTSYPNANNTNVDVSKFHFEICTSNPSIDIAKYEVANIKVVSLISARNRDGWGTTSIYGTHSGGTNVSVEGFSGLDGTVFTASNTEFTFRYSKESGMLFSFADKRLYTYWDGSSGTWKVNNEPPTNDNHFRIRKVTELKMTSVYIGYKVANGSIIEVYEV